MYCGRAVVMQGSVARRPAKDRHDGKQRAGTRSLIVVRILASDHDDERQRLIAGRFPPSKSQESTNKQ